MPLTRILGGGEISEVSLIYNFFRNFNMKKKDIVSREAERQFLALLRAGLWGGKADMACFPESGLPDWKGILYLGRSQAVLPLIYDGMLTLPEEMRLHGPALMRLIAYVDRIEGLNRELDEASAEISARLAAEGIRSVLLKGQGLAVLYRIPGHRQCGDIDLYVGEENYRKAADIIRKWPDAEEGSAEKEKHVGFKFHGMDLELHRHALSMPGIRMAKKYKAWEYTKLMGSGQRIRLGESLNAVPDSSENTGGVPDRKTVQIPSPQFDVFYTFCHAFFHFMISGLGLRQLCDVVMLLHRFHTEMDVREFSAWLQEYKLDREWKLFVCLMVRHLGLPAEEAPLYDSSFSGLSDQLLDTIFDDGNFGQYKSLPDYSRLPILLKKAGSLLNHHIIFWRRLKFSRRQTFRHYFHLWYIGLFAFIHEV